MKSEPAFSLESLEAAVTAGALDAQSAEKLKAFLIEQPAQATTARPRFDITHVLWYAGALIIMAAMGLYSTLAFEQMGGKGLAITGALYGLVLWFMGDRLWRKEDTRTPGGLLIAAAVGMVPLVVYGIQQASGNWLGFGKPGSYQTFYTFIKGGWLPMEIATILAGVIAARRYPFAFIAFPVAICLWFLSMDIAAYLAGDTRLGFDLRRKVSLIFGIALFIATWAYELRKRSADFAFWLHLIAATTFWGGLTFQYSTSEIAKLGYCAINIGLIAMSLFIGRRIYSVFGVIGIMVYLGHLAHAVFKDSLLFPFALSLLGLALVALGIAFAKRRKDIENKIESWLPASFSAARPYPARNKVLRLPEA